MYKTLPKKNNSILKKSIFITIFCLLIPCTNVYSSYFEQLDGICENLKYCAIFKLSTNEIENNRIIAGLISMLEREYNLDIKREGQSLFIYENNIPAIHSIILSRNAQPTTSESKKIKYGQRTLKYFYGQFSTNNVSIIAVNPENR